MSLGTIASQELVRQVIRGDKPVCDLESLGVTTDRPAPIHVRANVRDLAQGLLAYRADSSLLKQWAILMETEGFADWGQEDQHPAWDVLWDGIWSASFGEPIPEAAIHAAEALMEHR
jgi:hypothetical protein